MKLNDEYLFKVYLQCGDSENLKESYYKIKKSFKNIVKNRENNFHLSLCKHGNFFIIKSESRNLYFFREKRKKHD